LVFPNTDNKYTKDIAEIDKAMGDWLFILVNPFWRDIETWGFNLLAPKGKEMPRKQSLIVTFKRLTVCFSY
jgi:hypothetical protein